MLFVILMFFVCGLWEFIWESVNVVLKLFSVEGLYSSLLCIEFILIFLGLFVGLKVVRLIKLFCFCWLKFKWNVNLFWIIGVEIIFVVCE